jgi:hypothetical protein
VNFERDARARWAGTYTVAGEGALFIDAPAPRIRP